MLNELANHLCRIFGTDQSYHAEQQGDGTYRKKAGLVTPAFLEKSIKNEGSVAIYQKNKDTSIRWICFDFDILKSNLEESKVRNAGRELNQRTKNFCLSLDELRIPYLLEVSGNRGFHVWITLSEPVGYQVGYDMLQAITEKAAFEFNKEQIAVDFFPATRTPTDGVGLGVKIPLSKHKKTGHYSQLLASPMEIDSWSPCETLDKNFICRNLEILRRHTGVAKRDIEKQLGVILDVSEDESVYKPRVKLIRIHNVGFTLDELRAHWALHPPLAILANKIFNEKKLTHEERKLLVGIFGNIDCKSDRQFGEHLLHQIFQQTSNYNAEITQRTIRALSSFYFPVQEQIERVAGATFSESLSVAALISACVPKYHEHKDATFNISHLDVEAARVAEQNYLLVNDEAQSKIVLNELSVLDSEELLTQVLELLKAPRAAKFYRHTRNEEKKARTLYTLEAPERVLTSCILKQLIYFFGLEPSENSLGYRVNKGFAGGYIFEPWLYLWIKFIANISGALEDKDNAEFYIVKADVSRFYDEIPHDNLKRMLLGGVNPKIDKKREQLTGDLEEEYKTLIDALFLITERVVGGTLGVPQGPAYARYLAELYLDNIDAKFDKWVSEGELRLYQRYVDDIFFVAPTVEAAQCALSDLTRELELLGLQLNSAKTVISKIKNFGEDFNRYRSQSKYAVDRVSKNFDNATETQQSVAITEFMKLVQSDSCEDDLSFIFSHLNGVPQLDRYKREKVVPTLKSGVGRGSVYKHLFTFVLDNPSNFELLYEIEKFTELQSEVLTSVFITALETNKSRIPELNKLFNEIRPRLSNTDLVAEHLCYISITFNPCIDLVDLRPEVIIKVLATVPSPENIQISPSLLSYLNTALNNIKSLSDFTRAIYPLCATKRMDKTGLNSLASTFYAKLATDEANDLLSVTSTPSINTAVTGLKFYYLLCLFSASNKNSSRDLLKAMWKYCAFVHNLYNIDSTRHVIPNWFIKIQDIEIDHAKCQFIISSIVDGNIFRGLTDNSKVFERFHTLLLIFFAFKNDDCQEIDVEEALDALKGKAVFYRWLIDRGSVQLFPSSRAWFEKNVIENSLIALKRQNEVLIRRPTNEFYRNSSPINEHNGYSELIEKYDPTRLKALAEALENLSVREKLSKLISVIEQGADTPRLPNIFCNERILDELSLRPFSLEFLESANLIFEDTSGGADSYINNRDNFIRCFLRAASNGRGAHQIKEINDKYINNVDAGIDLFGFVKLMCNQLADSGENESSFFFDVAAGAALYSSLLELDPIRRIERFTDVYHKFNLDLRDRHLYAVSREVSPADDCPLELLDTVEKSLGLIPTTVLPSLAFFLDKDIGYYRLALNKIVDSESTDANPLKLSDFRRVVHRTLVMSETIKLDKTSYKFFQVRLVNPVSGEMVPLVSKHAVLLDSSEHVYAVQKEGLAFVIAVQSSISKIYDSVVRRVSLYSSGDFVKDSFPGPVFDDAPILALDNFHRAVDVVATHRDIPRDRAKTLLTNWLRFLPHKFHRPLAALIAAHHVMTIEEVRAFISKVRLLIADKSLNAFLIKDVGDYNGTHRVLYSSGDIGRNVAGLSPASICDGAEAATIIADNVISGSQIISAIKYYATGEGHKESSMYFRISDSEKESLKTRLKDLRRLNLCTILYTSKGLANIMAECRSFLNSGIEVCVINGCDIGDDAYFGSTQLLGEVQKDEIRAMLSDRNQMNELYTYLAANSRKGHSGAVSVDDINKTNLVARYQSLPKKCFKFLYSGLKHDADCHPMVRILEVDE